MEFDKSVEDLFRLKVPQTEFAHPGGVNHIAAMREVVKTRSGGGVLAQTRNIRNIVGQDLLLETEKIIQQAGFPHAGLTGKDADAPGQRFF